MKTAKQKLLDRVRMKIRLKGYSIRTEKTYVSWIKRFILYHNKRHPKDMGKKEIEAFLSHLAITRHVASSTQNQAFYSFTIKCSTVKCLTISAPPVQKRLLRANRND